MLSADSSSPSMQITRDDLASVVAVYRRESKRLNTLGALGMFGAVAIGLGLIGLSQVLGWVDDWLPVFMILMYALGAAALIAEWVARRRMVERIQVQCAHCDAPLLGSGIPRGVLSRAEMTVATGWCSRCGGDFTGVQNERTD